MAEQAYERIQRQLAEEAEKKRLASAPAATPMDTKEDKPRELSAAVQIGIAAGNINISSSGERHELSSEGQEIKSREDDLLESFERRKKMRQVLVPTDDAEVKVQLRTIGEPICLFGEGPADRRDRLRDLLASDNEGYKKILMGGVEEDEKKEEVKEVWYHKGAPELQAMREWILRYSAPRAQERLNNARIQLSQPPPQRMAEKQKLHNQLRAFASYGSQVADSRPIAYCSFAPDSKSLATASWSGLCKVWSVPNCKLQLTLKGHKERAGAIEWHPQACISQEKSAINLASCAADGSVCLWNLEKETPLATLKNHGCRVARLKFHPSGRLLGTTCYDNSWRLWDVETNTELTHQEGHSRPVYGIAFQRDGSLAATCSLDAQARVWDLRSGKNILVLQGHVKQVLGIDFSPNGFHLATGSDDHTVRLWDLRQQKCIYTLPAHTNMISSLVYQKSRGDCFVTGSYDASAKIWSAPGCTPLNTLGGNEGRVMCVDLSADDKFIATASYDRTFKLFQADTL